MTSADKSHDVQVENDGDDSEVENDSVDDSEDVDFYDSDYGMSDDDVLFENNVDKGCRSLIVGIDANNQMLPVAYAVVEGETKSSWLWFIQLLIEDIGIENQHGWTFITFKQKGLIPALEELEGRDQMNLPILPKSWGHNYRSCKNLPNREYQLKNKPRWKSLCDIRKKGWINIIPSISTNGNPNTNTNGNTQSSFGHSNRSFSNSKGTKSIYIKGKFTSTKGNFCSNGNFNIECNNSSKNQGSSKNHGNSNKGGKSNTNRNKCNNNKGGIITNI
ncbi:unnamed protein product [Camellia sinensis]